MDAPFLPSPGPAVASVDQLTRELENFEDIARYLIPLPGEVPRVDGLDVWGGTLPLGRTVGGDHIIYVDFKQRFDLPARIASAAAQGRHDIVANLERCQRMAGIAVIDVAGHRMTDALLAAMFHQAFLVGALYELDMFGHITKRLFENLNTRFYRSSGAHKFVSLLYGEISDDARVRFLSAAQPFPLVFSRRHDRFMEVSPELCLSFPPLGMLPSLDSIDRRTDSGAIGFKEEYALNEWRLMGAGDVLLMHTDGLSDHRRSGEAYFPARLEALLRTVKDRSAKEIFEAIIADIVAFGPRSDDVGIVVVKLAM